MFKGLAIDEHLIKKIFKRELKEGEIDPDYYFDVAKKLTEAVVKGMGKSVAIESKKTALYDKLRNNIYAFSAAKNLAMMQEFSKQLTDENNEVRSYAAFRNAVIKIDEEFNDHYLRTEYNAAIAMAQSADKWDSVKHYEYIKYRTVGDNKVRAAHKKLDGLVLRTDDKLWDKIFPPNDWGCRCTVIPVINGTVDEKKRAEADTFSKTGIKPYFQKNAGKEQVVFHDDHPYFARFEHDLKKGKIHQFMAAENYAMPPVESIMKRKLPALNSPKTPEEAKKMWEQAEKHIRTADGLEWRMDDRWEHVVNQNNQERWKLINHAKDVLENADEVWSYREQNPAGGYRFFKRYVKYYEGRPVVFSYDMDKPNAWTMYESDVDETGNFANLRNRIRRGVLIYRK